MEYFLDSGWPQRSDFRFPNAINQKAIYDFRMVRECPSCSTHWKSIVNFCPECGTDLRIRAEKEARKVPIEFAYEGQALGILKSPVLWISIGLLVFGATLVVKSSNGGPVQSASQVAQGDNQAPPTGSDETQVDPNLTESEKMGADAADQQADATPQDPDSMLVNPSKTFSEPKTKATLTLDAWLRKYSIDSALISIQKWSATYKSINPTQLDEAQNELGDAVSALEDALRHLNSQGSTRISTYDQQQKGVEREIQDFQDSAGTIWIRINNDDFDSRQELVDFLAENVSLLGKVNIRVNSLLEWIKTNGSKYEVR